MRRATNPHRAGNSNGCRVLFEVMDDYATPSHIETFGREIRPAGRLGRCSTGRVLLHGLSAAGQLNCRLLQERFLGLRSADARAVV
jgi:hypothetical protein